MRIVANQLLKTSFYGFRDQLECNLVYAFIDVLKLNIGLWDGLYFFLYPIFCFIILNINLLLSFSKKIVIKTFLMFV
jgi:hypothetical protein